jgi:Ca2+/Na+ antiporter
MTKLILFVIVSVLFFISVYIDGMNDNWLGILYMSLMYGLFILVSLYELGRIEIEKEENENRNNREQDI